MYIEIEGVWDAPHVRYVLDLMFKILTYFPFTCALDDRIIRYAIVVILLNRIINAARRENAAWRAQLARHRLAKSIIFFNVNHLIIPRKEIDFEFQLTQD